MGAARIARLGVGMSGCDFVDAQGKCAELRDCSNVAIEACAEANERIRYFEGFLQVQQRDLYDETLDAAVDQITREFWLGCKHGESACGNPAA
jgi:hypothetical protein